MSSEGHIFCFHSSMVSVSQNWDNNLGRCSGWCYDGVLIGSDSKIHKSSWRFPETMLRSDCECYPGMESIIKYNFIHLQEGKRDCFQF